MTNTTTTHRKIRRHRWVIIGTSLNRGNYRSSFYGLWQCGDIKAKFPFEARISDHSILDKIRAQIFSQQQVCDCSV